jgi:small-conductance mechanosensitive channel
MSESAMRARVRTSLALFLTVLVLGTTPRAAGQEGAGPGASEPASGAEATPPRAELVVRNRTLAVFRSVVAGYAPAERVELAQHRIETLLRREGTGAVEVKPAPEGSVVTVDGALALTIARKDVDAAAGEGTEATALQAAAVLRKVLEEAREARDVHALGVAAALAAGVTAVYAVLLWGLMHASRFLRARFVSAARTRAHRLPIQNVLLLDRSRLRVAMRRLVFAIFWALALLLTYAWISRILQLFPFTRPWGERLDGFLIDAAEGLAEGILGAVPALLIAFAILLIARFATSLLGRFFDRVAAGRVTLGWLDADTVRPTRRLVMIGVWLFALAMAYPYLPGSNTEAFKGLSVLVGLMVSIGGASVVGQALAGLILMYTHTFRIGDYVRVGECEGTVVAMGMYQTRIRTGLGDELTLPSSLVLGSVTRNYSRPVTGHGFVLDTTVTIGYDVPWRQVHAMLEEAAQRTPGLTRAPAARVYQTALSDFYVEYRLVTLATMDSPRSRAEALGALHEHIQDVFNEHGVQIMSPHYQLDPGHAKVVPKERWYEAPAERPQGPEGPGA